MKPNSPLERMKKNTRKESQNARSFHDTVVKPIIDTQISGTPRNRLDMYG